MYAVMYDYTDGCTYSGDSVVAVFSDEEVANLLAIDLNDRNTDKYCGFSVQHYAVRDTYTLADIEKFSKEYK